MGLFGMSKKEKAAVASNQFSVGTRKSKDEISKAINKEFISWKHVDGSGYTSLYNEHFDTIVEFYISDQGGGVSLLQMQAVPVRTLHPAEWKLWMSEIYNLMKKVEKRIL